MKNLLFICTENRLRSATAEAVFLKYENVDAIGAGTNADAPTTVSGDLIDWADVIFVMETQHKKKVDKKFRQLLRNKRLIVLGIPDNYSYMQPELVAILKARVVRHVHIREAVG